MEIRHRIAGSKRSSAKRYPVSRFGSLYHKPDGNEKVIVTTLKSVIVKNEKSKANSKMEIRVIRLEVFPFVLTIRQD